MNASMIGILERGNCGFHCGRERERDFADFKVALTLLIHGEAIVVGF